MTTKTLDDKIARNFSEVKIKKVAVKVPKLKLRKKIIRARTKQKKDDKIPVSSIIKILIKNAVEKAKRENKVKVPVNEGKSYTLLKDDGELIANGGYGTVSKRYGNAPQTSYIDYEKLFSYLGKFRAQSAYENMGNHIEVLNKSTESGSFVLADTETMEKGARYVKYMIPQTVDFINIASTSLVPISGMSSAEWEQFKLWMKLDPVMYRLKTSTS